MSEPSEVEVVLDAIETVDRILADREVEAALQEVVRSLNDVFESDRAFLSFLKPVSRGALFEPVIHSRLPDDEVGEAVFDKDEFHRLLFAEARDDGEIITCGGEDRPIPADSLLAAQGVRSAMLVAVQPRLGPGWLMGIHDCRRERAFRWEPRLFERIAARMADAVTSHRTLEYLRQSEERFLALIENTSEAMLLIDVGTQRVVYVSVAAERVFDWPSGQLLGTELERLSPARQPDGSDSEQRMSELLGEVAAGKVRELEWTFKRPDDSPLRAALWLVVLPDSERLLVRASVRPLDQLREAG